jgi:sugar phosphate isomerase/epimerase
MHPDLSLTSDYNDSTGCPEYPLKQIAKAGFSHVHWCHQWNTDFLYSRTEILQIARWLREFHLKLLDLHASSGVEKNWASPREYERQAGVELVRNRIEMAARLGSDAIIMHAPPLRESKRPGTRRWHQLLKSLDALQPFSKRHGVRIAIENMTNDDFRAIRRLFARYEADYLGLCYDSGHGNIGGKGLDHLEKLKERLIAVHLHDNHGKKDEHGLAFSGTVDWRRLARILAESSYRKCPSFELSMLRSGMRNESKFLKKALATGRRLAGMIQEQRQNP